MHNENYSIIFSSMTGNTRKLADKIHEILPKESCDYFGTADAQGTESELLYIGFCDECKTKLTNTLRSALDTPKSQDRQLWQQDDKNRMRYIK